MAYVKGVRSPVFCGAWMLKLISLRVLLTILADRPSAARADRSPAGTPATAAPAATIQQTATANVPDRLYDAVTSRTVPVDSVIQSFRIVDNPSIVNYPQNQLPPRDAATMGPHGYNDGSSWSRTIWLAQEI